MALERVSGEVLLAFESLSSLQAHTCPQQLRQELAKNRSLREKLQAENTRMAVSHTAFIQEHRERLQENIRQFSQWLESGDRLDGEAAIGLAKRLDSMSKDHALTYSQL